MKKTAMKKAAAEKTDTHETQLWIMTPFERPDAGLARAAAKAGAFPVLHLGRDKAAAEAALSELSAFAEPFGVCVAEKTDWAIALPETVSRLILPWGTQPPESGGAALIWQVRTAAEAEAALAAGAKSLILKGAEGTGFCGEDSTFILFQQLIGPCRDAGAAVYIQGGIGVHSAAAYGAFGAAGVILDAQVALFPECNLAQARKSVLNKLTGNEIRNCEGFHYYVFPGTAELDDRLTVDGLLSQIAAADGEAAILPMGQDIIIAADLADEYKRLKRLVRAMRKAFSSHVKQARNRDAFAEDGDAAKSLGIRYPIAQGPMARISDVPEFLRNVADGGALPFLAMGMMRGESAAAALSGAAEAMADKPWGVGIMGFIYPNILEEQTKRILETKPPFVLIAGGYPAQAKIFEKAGIKTLLHAPTPGLLDMFMKEKARAFIFEGRESGGHVGPLFSTVLWEKQINRLIKADNLFEYCLFFAGGIHDALSAAFVRVMIGPLSARGAQTCLQCGTAYLYTEEAVASGAMTDTYQNLLIEKDRTLLLKSGNGQETRCIPSQYTDAFFAEKARMEQEGLSSGEVLLNLEKMNLGRLRAAAKGVERVDGALVQLSQEAQIEKGLYMTGAVTALADKTTTVADLHFRLITDSFSMISTINPPEDCPAPTAVTDIAVIGMAGIFPGAEDIDEYWRNILFGRDCITEVPKERWSAELFYDPETKNTDHVVSKWGGFLGKSDFDALEFGITPQSLAAIEPVQILSLLVAKRALEDAGFKDLSLIDLDDTAVIFGAEGAGELTTSYGSRAGLMQLLGEIPKEAQEVLPRLTEDSFPGVLSNVIAGRISNRLNTGGRNFTVDAACASSLAALDIAISELESKRAGMVVLGGADLHNSILDYLMFSSTYALSKKGRCASFDTEADGITLGEGIGVVILKRLEDAQRDNNRIYAVVKGVGGSSDGKNLGLTAPSKSGQTRALLQAYETTGIRPSDVGLIESHGTGTVVGDKIEMSALTDVFLDDGTPPGQIIVSSVKSLIGHTKCAAGVAGLIKGVNCVRHGLLPPSLHLKKPNGAYTKDSPFVFRTEKAGYWREQRRIAGISGFGFGGTNFHAIIQNYEDNRPETPLISWPAELFVFSGDTKEAAEEQMGKIEALFEINDRLRLRDVAYTLARRADGQPIQYAIVAGTREELTERIRAAKEGTENENIHSLKAIPGKVAFLFPGQGSQRVNMAAELFLVFPKMRRLLNDYPAYERILFPVSAFTEEEKDLQRARITDTRNAQPILGIADLAIANLLKDLGIVPDALAGHSYGELPALCFAEALKEEELIPLSAARAGAIMDSAPEDPGKMTAVFTDAATLENLLDGEKDVWAVNFNTPRQTVIAGTAASIAAFHEKLTAANVSYKELKVACAFHSPLLSGADERFAAALREMAITVNTPQIPVMSNTSAESYPADPDGIRQWLAAHLVNPVRFTEEIRKMSEDGVSVFIEAGPGGAMIKQAADILRDKDIAVIQTEQSGTEGLTFFLQGLAKYIATGRVINMSELFEGRETAELDIDNPDTYKKNFTVWKVDGKSAVPENGELPAHAGKPITDSTLLMSRLKQELGGGNPEQVMMTYLQNMNAMIEDQRDVMLGYLGAPEMMPRAGEQRRRFALPDGQEPATDIAVLDEDTEIQIEDAEKELPDIESLTTEQITDMIFDIVSEKTGYPVEMLELDMDLEADLSIDSIKKMEIVGGLRDRVKLPEAEGGDDEANMDYFFEKIISIKTFRDLIEWIEEMRRAAEAGELVFGETEQFEGAQIAVDFEQSPTEASSETPSEAPSEAPSKTPSEEELSVIRLTLHETPYTLGETDASVVASKTFAITDDGNGLAAKIAEALAALGAQTRILTGWQPSDGENPDLTDCDGLILINSFAGTRQYTVLEMFGMLKRMDLEKLAWTLVFDDFRGWSASNALQNVPEGFGGLIKTLAHEYQSKRFGIIQFETLFDPETIAEIVTNEITSVDYFPELFYRDGTRFQMLPEISRFPETPEKPEKPESEDKQAQTVLDEESVVVVLGGAQGITSHVVERMAKEIPCRYILLGRSENDPEIMKYAELNEVSDIRKYLIVTEKMKQPKEIETKAKAIYKSLQVVKAVARVSAAGGKAEYRSVDVTDHEAFAAALAQIKEQYGRIDGMIHAAGILEDKRFREKQADSFARVYNTKTKPVGTILTELLPELKLFIMFGSMAASFGNVGQCDYAAGNSALDTTAWVLKRQCPALKVITFDWGPWGGSGMVNDSLRNEFLKKGISFISLDEGSQFVMDEIKYGDVASVLAITCEERAALEFIDTVSSGGISHGKTV